jgi:hypothetical protein
VEKSLVRVRKKWELLWIYMYNKILGGKAYVKEWKMAVVCPVCKSKGKVREYCTEVPLLPAMGTVFPVLWPVD